MQNFIMPVFLQYLFTLCCWGLEIYKFSNVQQAPAQKTETVGTAIYSKTTE